jgi:hypothetical protein
MRTVSEGFDTLLNLAGVTPTEQGVLAGLVRRVNAPGCKLDLAFDRPGLSIGTAGFVGKSVV